MNPLLSPEQCVLLSELAEFIQTRVQPRRFELSVVQSGGIRSGEMHLFSAKSNCGTTACGIGYAPLCHPELHKDAVGWAEVANPYCGEGCEGLWAFMFGDEWTGVQNTPIASAVRIQIAVKYHDLLSDAQWGENYELYINKTASSLALEVHIQSQILNGLTQSELES
jgi:hypothetical protein